MKEKLFLMPVAEVATLDEIIKRLCRSAQENHFQRYEPLLWYRRKKLKIIRWRGSSKSGGLRERGKHEALVALTIS